MRRYEYLVYSVKKDFTEFKEWKDSFYNMRSNISVFKDKLSELGENGWLMTTRYEVEGGQEITFARELEPEVEKAASVEI